MNILTTKEKCERSCRLTWWRTYGTPHAGDVRQCEHGRWWRATGGSIVTRDGATSFDTWRPATHRERRRIKALAESTKAEQSRIPTTSEDTCESCGRILSCVGTCPKGCDR